MSKPSDMQVIGVSLYFLPIKVHEVHGPLRIGSEMRDTATCSRVRFRVADKDGRIAEGWGEVILDVDHAWPGALTHETRQTAMKTFCVRLAEAWLQFNATGHPLELGHHFQEEVLTDLWQGANKACGEHGEPMPWVTALVCAAAFDLALHDAFGNLHQKPVYEMYGPEWMNQDLSAYLTASSESVSFKGRHPSDYLVPHPPSRLKVWHMVGPLDALEPNELTKDPSQHKKTESLLECIERDGFKCLKVCLEGANEAFDYERLVKVAKIASDHGVDWLAAGFQDEVTDPHYLTRILDRLRDEYARFYGMLLYVELPLPTELDRNRIDMRCVSARKPLLLDGSAYDWKMVQKGRELGWTGVALSVSTTQTAAILSACWAQAHGMTLMAQDPCATILTQNPLKQLAAHAGTMMGIVTNGGHGHVASSHALVGKPPGMSLGNDGMVDGMGTGSGFGYPFVEISRQLPPAAAEFSREPRRPAFQPTIALLRKARRP